MICDIWMYSIVYGTLHKLDIATLIWPPRLFKFKLKLLLLTVI